MSHSPLPINVYRIIMSLSPLPINVYHIIMSLSPLPINVYHIIMSLSPLSINVYHIIMRPFCLDCDKSLEEILAGGRPKKDQQQQGILSTMLQFSAQTSSARTQLALTHKLIKKGRDTLGAPKGKKVWPFFNIPY